MIEETRTPDQLLLDLTAEVESQLNGLPIDDIAVSARVAPEYNYDLVPHCGCVIKGDLYHWNHDSSVRVFDDKEFAEQIPAYAKSIRQAVLRILEELGIKV